MKILIDTNILVDVLVKRDDFYQDSLAILRTCESKKTEGFVSALSFANIMYICKKLLNTKQLEHAMKTLHLFLNAVDLTGNDIIDAFSLQLNDYEDSLQTIAAQKVEATYLITRNKKDFDPKHICAITPTEFIARHMK